MAAKMARQSAASLGGGGYTPLFGTPSTLPPPPPPMEPQVMGVQLLVPAPPPPEREPFPFGDPEKFSKDSSRVPSGDLPVAWFVTASPSDPRWCWDNLAREHRNRGGKMT
eukprot:TRINITY_DN18830_c0_g1_i3.p1 TRINITY_DN18830_c0_g1~~TRINITY_DN18830_c0_g1_i3.p1  ORF type:complete len:110 (+),score=17.96 TRINITY_DN18830_c0_g1_i3:176-505(+)